MCKCGRYYIKQVLKNHMESFGGKLTRKINGDIAIITVWYTNNSINNKNNNTSSYLRLASAILRFTSASNFAWSAFAPAFVIACW